MSRKRKEKRGNIKQGYTKRGYIKRGYIRFTEMNEQTDPTQVLLGLEKQKTENLLFTQYSAQCTVHSVGSINIHCAQIDGMTDMTSESE